MVKVRKQLFELTIASSALAGVAMVFWQSPLAGVLNLFSYYTIQTNLIAAALLIYRALRKRAETEILDIATTSITIWIFITGAGYHFMLSASHSPIGLAILSNLLIHYLTPITMVIYYLTTPARRKKGVWTWFTYPALYYLSTLARGATDGFYPYWFIDPTSKYPQGIGSYWNAFLFALIMVLIYLVIGHVLHGARHRLALLRHQKQH